MYSDDKGYAGLHPIQQLWVSKGSAGEMSKCGLSAYCVPGSKPEPFTSLIPFNPHDHLQGIKDKLVPPKRKLGGVRAVR